MSEGSGDYDVVARSSEEESLVVWVRGVLWVPSYLSWSSGSSSDECEGPDSPCEVA